MTSKTHRRTLTLVSGAVVASLGLLTSDGQPSMVRPDNPGVQELSHQSQTIGHQPRSVPPTISEPWPQAEPQVTNGAERNGVRLSLFIERSVYHPGETVRVKAVAENVRKTAVVLCTANVQDDPIYIVVDTPFYGNHLLRNSADPEVVSPAESSVTVKPYQESVREVTWDLMLQAGLAGPVPAPPGEYPVTAFVTLGPCDSSSKNRSLRVAAQIVIEGSKPIISMLDALKSAVQQPQVSGWFERHGGTFVFRSSREVKYYRLEQGELKEIDGTEWENTGGSGGGNLASCAIHLEPGPNWKFYIAIRNEEMSVLLNGTSGEVLEIKSKVYR
ncbi:MAG TPA: hypothetical protein VFV34_17775 [Blastocatellia bacterium]|nr:hypothetical protein [Blastocatellia bacterium]